MFPTRIKIIHGSYSLYDVLPWVKLFSLYFIRRIDPSLAFFAALRTQVAQ